MDVSYVDALREDMVDHSLALRRFAGYSLEAFRHFDEQIRTLRDGCVEFQRFVNEHVSGAQTANALMVAHLKTIDENLASVSDAVDGALSRALPGMRDSVDNTLQNLSQAIFCVPIQ